jgi:choline/glycine/proline betaine transport protein
LFGLLGELPGGTALVAGAVILIVLFFVTSSDSGSLVVTMLSSGGDVNPPIWSRVFWAVAEGLVAITLLLAGGLGALQVGAILIALPFSFVMLAMCVATWRELAEERRRQLRLQRKLQREELTAQVSQSLLEEGWTDPNGGMESSRASAAGAVEDRV